MKNLIYMDNAATTALSPNALEAMLPFFKEEFGNASTLYPLGEKAKEALENSRKIVAKFLNAEPNEIFFTSGGTESDNWALKGIMHASKAKAKTHLITTKIEHHAVLHSAQALEKEGFRVTYLDVDENGLINLAELERSISPQTAMVSIMYANNEIGTVQPIKEIGEICKKHDVLFHTDAVQAVGNINIDVKFLNIDLLSLSAHKFHGPKGVGALFIKRGTKIETFMAGGAQESKKRAGTENIPGIVGLAFALQEASLNLEENNQKVKLMQEKIINSILKISHTRLNGDPIKRLPGNISFCFRGIEGESLLLKLANKGICASSGSACTSGSLDPSHVLLAIGLPHEVAHGSLRISINSYNTQEQVDYLLDQIPEIILELRKMSPLWEKIIKEEKIIEGE